LIWQNAGPPGDYTATLRTVCIDPSNPSDPCPPSPPTTVNIKVESPVIDIKLLNPDEVGCKESEDEEKVFDCKIKESDVITLDVECFTSQPGPRVKVDCTAEDLPSGATFSSTPGNPASGTLTWDNTDNTSPPGTYTTVIKATCPDITCDDSDSALTINIIVNSSPTLILHIIPGITIPGATVTLDASQSYDEDVDDLTFAWQQVKFDPTEPDVPVVNLIPVNAKSSIVQFDAPVVNETTELHFTLSISDGFDINIIGFTVVVIINNPPNPIIDVLPSNTVESGTIVTLDATRSNDPDPGDSITSYRWIQTDGPDLGLGTLNTPIIQFIAPEVNQDTTFTFLLHVTDTFGNLAGISSSITVKPKLIQNNPPVAVATCTTPDGVCTNIQPDSQIRLTGFKSYDPDAPNDFVVGYQWKKTSPEDKIVKDTLTSPNSIETTFNMPYFVPYQFTSLSTPPTLLPIEFSLMVTDTHGTKSQPDKLSINMECSASDKRRGEHFRDLLRGAIIFNNEFPSLNPQTADNMRYFLSGAGDIIPNRDPKGNFVEVTENDNPKPLPIEWLENTRYFQKAQQDLAKLILKDVNDLLKQMKVGESRILNPTDPYQVHIETSGNFPTDFVTAIGSAPAFADVSLTITKGSLFKANSISGKIELKLVDIYDFNPGQIFRLPLLGVATSADIYNAIKCLGARNFDQTTIYNKIITDMNVRDFLKDFPDCDDPDECKIQQ
jgi:hypothetical protein